MKFLTFAFFLLSSLSFAGDQLVAQKKIQLKIVSGDLEFGQLRGELHVYCKYKSGLFFPESKSCGSSKTNLEITEDGILQIPSVNKFTENANAWKKTNYDFSLFVFDQKNSKNHFFLGWTGYTLKEYQDFNKTINFINLTPARVDVTVEGAPLIDSPIANAQHGFFGITLSAIPSIPSLYFGSTADDYLFVADNNGSSHPQIHEIQEIILKGGLLAYVDGQTLELFSWLADNGIGNRETFIDRRTVDFDSEVLTQISLINLLKK